MDRPVFFSLLVFSFAMVLLYLVYSVLAPFLAPLGWATVIGISTWPAYRILRCRLNCHENLSAAILTLISLLVIVLPVFGLVSLIYVEIMHAYEFFGRLNEAGQLNLDALMVHPMIAPLMERVRPLLDRLDINLQQTLSDALRRSSGVILNLTTPIIKNVLGFVFKLVIMVIALFFFYRDGEDFLKRFWSVVPLSPENKSIIEGTVKRVLTGVIYGVFLTCLLQGFLGGIGYWISGLPSPALLGAMTAVCALIPFVGTALIWLPGVVFLLIQGNVFWGVFLAVWGMVAIGSSDNVFRPLFISGRAQIHILVTALGGIGGLAAFGLFGAVSGPLLLALFIDLADMYVRVMYRRSDAGVTDADELLP